MDSITFIGSIAALCTTISFLPQVIKVRRTRHTADLSLPMYVIFSLGVLLWTCYGVMTGSWPIMLANTITLGLSLYIVAMKVKYK